MLYDFHGFKYTYLKYKCFFVRNGLFIGNNSIYCNNIQCKFTNRFIELNIFN